MSQPERQSIVGSITYRTHRVVLSSMTASIQQATQATPDQRFEKLRMQLNFCL